MRACKRPLQPVRYFVVLCATLILNGCTTTESNDIPPEQLRDQVRAGILVQPGEIVSVFTAEREYHDISITAVSENYVSYEELIRTEDGTVDEDTFEANESATSHTVNIPIDGIVKITRKEPTAVGYAVGITAGAAMGWLLVALPVVIIGALAF